MPRWPRQWLMASPACPAPMMTASVCMILSSGIQPAAIAAGRRCRLRSGVGFDRNRDAVAQDVEHGGTGAGLPDDLLQFFFGRVAGDGEADPDAAEAVAYVVGQA